MCMQRMACVRRSLLRLGKRSINWGGLLIRLAPFLPVARIITLDILQNMLSRYAKRRVLMYLVDHKGASVTNAQHKAALWPGCHLRKAFREKDYEGI